MFIGVGNDTSNTVKGDVCKPTLHLYSCSEYFCTEFLSKLSLTLLMQDLSKSAQLS